MRKFVCSKCWSDKVCQNADIAWNEQEQKWEVKTILSAAVCNNCGTEIPIENAETEDEYVRLKESKKGGLIKVNRDEKTGIRYGVIPSAEVGQSWFDDSEPICHSNGFAYCQGCGTEIGELDETEVGVLCPDCGKKWEENQREETSDFKYEGEGIRAFQFDGPDIFIELSPYYALCRFCSPCAPGAGYLLDSDDSGIKAYCFPHDWFEKGTAPYRVFRVEDDEEILPLMKSREMLKNDE